MQLAPIPSNESARLADLYALNILDTPAEPRFDRIIQIAQIAFQIPWVFVTLVDADRVWMKSKWGSDMVEESRDTSFCGHTICSIVSDDPESRLMEVQNASADRRFYDNPYVQGDPPCLYYAGFALQSAGGFNVGTLCMLDTKPRKLSPQQRELFIQLGFMVEFEIRRESGECCPEERCGDYLLHARDAVEKRMQEFGAGLRRVGIGVNEWRVLHEIIAHYACFPHRIAQELRMARSSVTRLLDLLESKGLVERKYGQAMDRRQVSVHCSATGTKAWRAGIVQANKLGKRFWYEMGSFDWEQALPASGENMPT